MPFPRFSADELENWLVTEAIAERYELERADAHRTAAAGDAAAAQARELVQQARRA